MSRDDGFVIADIAVDYYSDPKVMALRRRANDNDLTRQCVLVHKATILASWRVGERVAIDDAALSWMFDDLERVRAALIDAELIDADSRLRSTPWDRWFLPARRRRVERRESGRKGGLAKPEAKQEAELQATVIATPQAELQATPQAQLQPNRTNRTNRTNQPNKNVSLATSARDRANGLGAGPVAKPKGYDELTAADFGITDDVRVDDHTSFAEKMAQNGLKPEIVPVDRDIMDETL